MLAEGQNNGSHFQKHTQQYFLHFQRSSLLTCDVEKDLDFLVSGRSPDSSLPLQQWVRSQGGVSLLSGEWARACCEAGLEISVILGTLSAPAVAPTPWCW